MELVIDVGSLLGRLQDRSLRKGKLWVGLPVCKQRSTAVSTASGKTSSVDPG